MISVRIHAPIPVPVSVGKPDPVGVNLRPLEIIEEQDKERYSGDYDIVPGDAPVTIDIKDKIASRDIVVQAVPSNYGKIEFDGAKLRIV